MEVQVIRAANVEIPVVMQPPSSDPELAALEQRFAAGEDLSKEELQTLARKPSGGGNGNCNVC